MSAFMRLPSLLAALVAAPLFLASPLASADGDDHTVGLSLVELTLREAGWRTEWAGGRTPAGEIVERVTRGGVKMVAISASSWSRETRALDRIIELLGPGEPGAVFRSAAWRQLRGVVLLPTIAGGVAGNIAAGHLDGNRVEWIVAGAAFGAMAALLAWGCALIASSRRWSVRRANAVGATLVAWAAIDIALSVGSSPTAQVGRVALVPLSWSWLALVGIALPFAVVGLGLAWIGGTSQEPLRHRAQLVRELRYAATLQDLRSIIVLHRELAQELPRSRPWCPWSCRPWQQRRRQRQRQHQRQRQRQR
jgi:hypothetical protein